MSGSVILYPPQVYCGVLIGTLSDLGVGGLTITSDRFAGRTAEAFTNIASRRGMTKVMYNSLFDDKLSIVGERSSLAS